jgi:lysophospholipase L1-like esterase
MILKDKLILTILSLGLGWVVVTAATTPIQVQSVKDTTVVDTPIVVNVKNKTALFIGDSHTANHTNGWQKVLSNKVGFNMINVSILGKTTYWMLNQAHLRLNNKIDYCFVYGGANDMYTSSITPKEAVNNIKGIARMCNGLGIKCVVITGFDPIKCTRTPNKSYASKYTVFQQLLLTEYIEFAQVIDTRVIARTECWDGLCHMNPTGHKKIADKVIKDLNLRVF